jgi:putative adenylate-forming enzyme
MKRKEIEHYQIKKARNIVNYAIHHSKFYHDYYTEYDGDDVWSLPTINKKMMMDNLTDFLTVGLTKEEIIEFCLEAEKARDFSSRLRAVNVALSSGTSGNKGVEIETHREESYMKAAYLARFNFLLKEKLNLAFILRVSSPALSLNKFGHKLTYISQLNTIDNIIEALERLRPNVISAPPSMLRILASEVEKGGLRVRPRALISYAEVLYQDIRAYLEGIFGCKVHEIYKCTEGAIANTCEYGKLHINEDLVAVQAIDIDGTPTQPGRPCFKMIVTDLHKISQPIIRYELNDIITISTKTCPCGSSFRVIEGIQGRADDLFWGRKLHGDGMQFIFPDYISRAIITASDEIENYQAIQDDPDKVLVRIIMKEPVKEFNVTSKAVKKNLEEVFRSYGCKIPDIKIYHEKPELNEYSLKLIRIHRKFEVDI